MTQGEALLLERFAGHARDRASTPALRDRERVWTWEELWRAARGFAGLARRHGVERGDRVLFALPNGGEFLAALLGVQLAGGVAVPLDSRSGATRLADLARFTCARLVVVPEARRAELVAQPSAGAAWSVGSAAEGTSHAPATASADPGANELALLQFTSGATGDPKGVELTHGCLATNVAQLVEGLEIVSVDVFVSWLPLSHDMGLVLMALVPLALGAELDLLPTDASGLRRWLPTIAERRATFTAAPDFAYRLVRSWFAGRSASLDLSSLRVALNAAEPVRATTVAAFRETFALGPVVTPGYGLAEATVGVTTGRPGEPLRTDARGLVALGRGLPGVDLRIVEADGRRAEPGREGEIEVASPALCRGYHANPSATAALFRDDGWLRTGDLGYLDGDGELYVSGRTKSILFVGGLSLAPQEVEETVDALPFVRRSAAVGVDRGRLEGEQIYVFAELAPKTPRGADLSECAIAVVAAIQMRLGVRPGRVCLLRSGEIPRTATGKVRYGELRRAYLAGELRRRGGVLYPSS